MSTNEALLVPAPRARVADRPGEYADKKLAAGGGRGGMVQCLVD